MGIFTTKRLIYPNYVKLIVFNCSGTFSLKSNFGWINIFFTELIKVEKPGSYEKEFWAMNDDEKLKSIPILKEDGNALFKSGDHESANKKYSEAIGRLEQLMLR